MRLKLSVSALILLAAIAPQFARADALDDELKAVRQLLLIDKAEEADVRLNALQAKARAATTADPADAHAQFILGTAAMYLGNDDVATAALSRATRLDPKNIQYALTRAQLAAMQEKRDEAITLYQAATAIDPKNSDAWYFLGDVQMDAARFADAQSSFQKAADLAPRDTRFRARVGNALVAQHKDEEAIVAYNLALSLDATNGAALASIGQLYQNKLDFEKALVAFTKAADLDPDVYILQAKIVQLNQALGKINERDAARDKILALYKAGKISANAFCRELFPTGKSTVMAFEYFDPAASPGRVHYAFNIVAADGKTVEGRISLGAAKADAAQTGFTLDAYSRTAHELLATYPAEPTYEQARDAAKQYLDGKLKPISSEPMNNPAPATGAAK